jgi:hypothetical protein
MDDDIRLRAIGQHVSLTPCEVVVVLNVEHDLYTELDTEATVEFSGMPDSIRKTLRWTPQMESALMISRRGNPACVS